MLDQKVIIRKGKMFDIPQLIKLYSGVQEIADFAGQKHDKNYFKAYISSKENALFVAVIGKELCGATNLEIDKPLRFVFLSNIVVSKHHRGKGIGGMLMKQVETFSKKQGIKRMLGLVYDWNINMQKIITHCGYVSNGKAIIYSKKI